MIVEFLELTFSRHDTCNLLCDTSLALARNIISSAVSVTVSIALDNTVVGNSSILPFYRIAMRSITWLEIK